MEKETIDLTVKIGDTEKEYKFTEMWQAIWFIKFLNVVIKFFDWLYRIDRKGD